MTQTPTKNDRMPVGKKMKFLSVCSGIEAVSVAWEPLQFEPVAYSEIEPFPSAVLAHHYPDVPNLGDMTQYANWNIPTIDILAGGTPCQSFSVAGKRGGLSDPRGNLCFTFCEIADRFDPEWILWENVPGVLNTVDNAFGCLLGKLCGASNAIQPAEGRKHASCGVVAGSKRTVAWRILDAQWFGVPQRRRRLFVLAGRGARNWACADALLPFAESLPGYFAPSRKARQKTPASTRRSPDGSHWDGRAHPTLGAIKTGIGLSDQELFSQRGACLVRDTAPITAKWGKDSGNSAGDEFQNIDINRKTAPDLFKNHETDEVTPLAACFGLYENQRAEMRLYENLQPTITCGGGKAGQGSNMTLFTFPKKDASLLYENHAQDSRIAGPFSISPTCTARWGTGGGNTPLILHRESSKENQDTAFTSYPGNEITLCFPLDMRTILRKDTSSSAGCGTGEERAPSYTLTTQGHVPGICYSIQGNIIGRQAHNGGNGKGFTENISGTLTRTDVHAVLYKNFVRRMMPIECERLQGFPDNWTLIDKKPGVPYADSHRYKAIGNSMAVPVIRWIGQRILAMTTHRQINQILPPDQQQQEQRKAA